MTTPLPMLEDPVPQVALTHLDDLWFQVGGTRCNLTCQHCFISCSPHNRSFDFLGLEAVSHALEESVALGVKEYYFTGGEPFLNPDMPAILELTLRYGPATVLTNGTVFRGSWLSRLRNAQEASRFSLEFRVSIDGYTAAANDVIRGEGTFARALRGVRQLLAHDFLPIVTVARTGDNGNDDELFSGFVALLRDHGYERPRIKVLPTLRLGAEIQRQRGYRSEERVTPELLEGFDTSQLLCSHGRLVSDRGVHVCPILLEAPDALLAPTLKDSLGPYALRHQACYTCYQYGTLCANPSGSQRGS